MGVVGYAGIPSVVNSSLLFLAAGYGIWDCVPDILWYFGELTTYIIISVLYVEYRTKKEKQNV